MTPHHMPIKVPDVGMSIARRVLVDAVLFHLSHGGPSVARAHVESLVKELIIYDDCSEAYREALTLISSVEREDMRLADAHRRKDYRDMMLMLIEGMNSSPSSDSNATDKSEQATADNRSVAASAAVVKLPPEFRTKKAMKLWIKLQQKRLVDSCYQPLVSRTKASVLAFELCKRLGIVNKWKKFEQLWHRKNMRNDYYAAQGQAQTSQFLDELNAVFSD